MIDYDFMGIHPPKINSDGVFLSDAEESDISVEQQDQVFKQKQGIFDGYTTRGNLKKKVANIIQNAYDNLEKIKDDTLQVMGGPSIIAKGPQKNLLIQTLDALHITGEKREFMLKSAYNESGYRLSASVKSDVGSACGWFGFINSTRKTIFNQIAKETGNPQWSNINRQQFLQSPKLQVIAASKLYDNIVNNNQSLLQKAKAKGLSTSEFVAINWLNPAWAKTYIETGRNAGADAFGTTVSKYLSKFRRTKI